MADNKQVDEDIFYAKVARDYEIFIYDYPWYDFPYYKYNQEFTNLKNSRDSYTFGEHVRKIERTVFIKTDLNFKRFYSYVIGKLTHGKFGVQDDQIAAITKNGLISAPHYQPFTKLLISKMDEAIRDNKEFEVLEIAGNHKITFSYLDLVGKQNIENTKEVLRTKETIGILDNKLLLKDRITVEVDLQDLFNVYKNMKTNNLGITHFYDY